MPFYNQGAFSQMIPYDKTNQSQAKNITALGTQSPQAYVVLGSMLPSKPQADLLYYTITELVNEVLTILFLTDGEKNIFSSSMRYNSCLSLLNGAVK